MTIPALYAASVGLSRLAKDRFARIRQAIGDAWVVLIGEETHGTQEFYALRAELTKALVECDGFSLVLCESDFPTFYELHRFVGGTHASRDSLASSSSASSSPTLSPTASTPLLSAEPKLTSYGTSRQAAERTASLSTPETSRVTAEEVMEALKERFPVWMWRNQVVRDFVEWLQHENLRRELHAPAHSADPHGPPVESTLPVALFGLDIYSMFSSTDQVIEYLDAVDPAMAERARQRYSVLQSFRPHEEEYCRAVLRGQVPPQHNPLKTMVQELRENASEFKNVFGDGDEFFNAQENARVVMAAEEYYRQSYLGGGELTWNIRDRAMVAMVLNALQFHDEKLQQLGHGNAKARAVVWAHNSHIGDAAATEHYARWGQVNVGHLVREALGKDACYLIGLTTATGTVRAARRWNGHDHVMELNAPLRDSVGDVLHQVAVARATKDEERDFALVIRSNAAQAPLSPEEARARDALHAPRLERFVGVQYVKPMERQVHYSHCRVSEQFDAVIHLEKTTALRPLPESSEPHVPMATTNTSMGSARPGAVDARQWDKWAAQQDDDDDEAMLVPP